MFIKETKQYLKDYKKKIVDKHLKKEITRIDGIKNLLISSTNFKEVMNSPYKQIYNITQKKGNLKEIFTAEVNQKLRLYMKPINNYPYNYVEIIEIEFIEIDDKHYGEG